MDFVKFKELEQTISRPSSTEMERAEAANQALRPDEEILEAREKESDRGFPAPLNQDLTAEEQAEFYRLVLEKRRQQIREDLDPSPNASEPEGSASVGDAMSSERACALDESGSDRMSFVTAMAGSASSVADRPAASAGSKQVGSRKERKKQRTAQHVQEKASKGYSVLSPVVHKMRKQSALMLRVPVSTLDHLSEVRIRDMSRALITMQVGLLSGGEPIQTRLMGSVQVTQAERNGVEGTVVRVSVAAESEVFLPTRDPEELARRRAVVLGELADQTLRVLNEVGVRQCPAASAAELAL